MRVQNENAPGVLSGIEFLKNFGLRKKIDIHGTVAVVGGGNTAIDCARTALRLGVEGGEAALPPHAHRDARQRLGDQGRDRGRREHASSSSRRPAWSPARTGSSRGSSASACELGEPDASGRRSPKPMRGSEFLERCDYIIAAIGQSTKISELVDGRVPNFLPLRRGARPDPLADGPGERDDVRDDAWTACSRAATS